MAVAILVAAPLASACAPPEEKSNYRWSSRGAIGLNSQCGEKASSLTGTGSGPAHGLTEGGPGQEDLAAFDGRVRSAVRPLLPPSARFVRLRLEWSETTLHGDYTVHFAGVPICGDSPVRAHQTGDRFELDPSVEMRALTRLSLPGGATDDALTWPDAEATMARAAAETATTPEAVISATRCWAVTSGGLEAALDLAATLDGTPYRIIGGAGRIHRMERVGFDATGSATVYDTNPVDGNLVKVPLKDLAEGTDRLQSARFSTVNDDDSPAAASVTREYHFEEDSSQFVETSLYTHAEQMADYYLENGGVIDHCLPIVIHAHAVLEVKGRYTKNNAQYVPAKFTNNGLPGIDVGDGDGVDLENLGVDFDVVAHELGHHVIYRKLTSQADAAGVIHEALADALVFAKTGNACLGESICPAGGSCYVPGKCLRSADNDMKYTDPDLPQAAHQRSMFVSGMLWDLGKSIGHATVGRLVLKSVDFLQARSDYTDLVKALMAADHALNGGKNACTIHAGAGARGLNEFIDSIQCDDFQ